MTLSSGTRLGPYEIIAALGAGGMGEVYRARDARLGRDVALKILPAAMAADPIRLERFTREAHAVAALNHPHIVTIYSTEEADGVRFLTMELVEGEPLDRHIPHDGLALTTFFDLAVPLADALAAAHQKNITHRDLKPANVMVSPDGRVKVLDFGLARFAEPAAENLAVDATRAPLTHEGTIVGTMPYMSPEQVEGKPLDPRSDLFSLGIVLYEMATGIRPFAGDSSALLMSSILKDIPRPMVELRRDVPPALAHLIARCLEKRPQDRVQTARDVYNELRHAQQQIESSAARRSEIGSGSGRGEASLRIAVLPFTTTGGDRATEVMADGLTEDITTGLSHFSYLSVLARHSVLQFRGTPSDVDRVGEQLGARYVLAGSVRRSATTVRVTARLTDTHNGVQLWSETYNRDLPASDPLTAQDEVTDRVVGTVADVYGVLLRSMTHALRDEPLEGLSASALALRYWTYQRQHTPHEHARLRTAIEQLVGREPNRTDTWAALAHLYCHEHMFGFNASPDALARARRAVTRALELDATDQHAWEALAITYFFERDREGFLHAAERAMALNPRNTNTAAWMGTLFAHMGEYDRGCEITERAMALNPHHPGWYHFAFFNRHYYRGEFAEALRAAKKVNMPDHLWSHWAIAVACGQLGRTDDARAAVATFLALAPEFADTRALRASSGRWKWSEEDTELGMEGFRKATQLAATAKPPDAEGAAAPTRRITAPSSAVAASDAARTRGLWIAVLPFAARTGDEQSAALAEGLCEDITAGLSRFSYLRVVSRAAAEPLKGQATDVRAASARLGARYLMEGSVRRAGATVRVSARVVDAETGAHLWAENFDRDLSGGTFALQDDVVSRVVATVGDANGVLVRSMAATLKDKPYPDLSATELVLRFHAYLEQFRPGEHARLRDHLERALLDEPSHADGWACLSSLIEHEFSHGLNPLPNSQARAHHAAERAIEADPVCQEAWKALASAHFFARDAAGVCVAAERAIALNPLNTGTVAVCALFLAFAGERERGLEVTRQAMVPNPHYPGWLHFVPFNYHYRRREYAEALQHAKQVNMPLFPKSHFSMAAAAGQLGLRADARTAFDALAKISPAGLELDRARTEWERWIWDQEELDHFLEGVRKAKALAGDAARPTSDAGRHASIAVLPFSDLSEARDQEWFCDGIAEEILNALTPLPGLHVAARTSAFSFRGKSDDLREIGEKLKVATVLEGSVRRAGDRVRITVQLIDVASGFHIWSERYDREVKDIFDVQDQIARAIVERLRVTLVGGADARLVSKTTTSVEAYELYLKARALLNQRGARILPALDEFRKAVELDPEYALAWAGIADAYTVGAYFGLIRGDEARRHGLAAARRALNLDPTSAEAHTAMATATLLYERDRDAAERGFLRALELNPQYGQARCWYALFYLQWARGRFDEGVEQARQALATDPLSAYVMTVLGACLGIAGRYEEAAEVARTAVERDPDSFIAHWISGISLAWMERFGEAESVLEHAARMSGRHHFALTSLATLYVQWSKPDRARAMHQELLGRAAHAYVPFTHLTLSAEAAGDHEQAIAFARRALEEREPPFALLARHFVDFRPLHRDPRFAALVRELDVPEREADV